MAVNGKPMKAKNPENHADFRGSSCEFAVTSYPAGTPNPPQIAGKTRCSEIPGAHTGAIESETDSQDQLMMHRWMALPSARLNGKTAPLLRADP